MKFLERFLKPEVRHLVVEIEKPRVYPPLNAEIAQSVATLQHHPGFLYLLNKLKLQRQSLISVLSTQRQATLKDIEFLQSGVAWTGWLDDQLNRAVNFTPAKPTAAFEEEESAFQEVRRFLEVVGGEEKV